MTSLISDRFIDVCTIGSVLGKDRHMVTSNLYKPLAHRQHFLSAPTIYDYFPCMHLRHQGDMVW
ncbi:uncharacterized protein METZ01_LOCUS478288, partial [marine metagenome]